MLQSIRDSAQGWIAWAIVILISIPFALWGINSYLGRGSDVVVASVNDREITEQEFENNYQRFRNNLRQQLGSAFDPNLFDEGQMRKDVLERMVRSELLIQAADRLGLGIGADMVRGTIAGIPSFQVNGRFDKTAYERGVRQQGFSTAEFEQQIRQAMVSEQLSRAITDSAFVTDAELEAIVRLKEQHREVSYLKLVATDFVQPGKLTEEAVQAYYDEHKNSFMAPEQVRLSYIDLSIAHLADSIVPEEEQLRGFFEQHREEYGRSDAQAREIAQQIVDRLKAGEDFAALAQELSDDSGSAAAGGDLGMIEKGMMDPPFDEALFHLELGKVSAPVKTSYGYHIIKFTEAGENPDQRRASHILISLTASEEEASKVSFDQVRDRVEKAYRNHEAERQFYEYAERLADLAYETPDSLEPAAEALGLKVVTSDWVDANGMGIPGGAKSMGAAFSEEVLNEGQNSEVIEVGPEHVLVLRVRDHKEASVRPLAEVKEQIEATLQKEQGSKLAREMGESLLERLKQGESLEQVAEGIGHKVEKPGSVGRNDAKLGAEISRVLFAMPRPQGEQPSYGQATTIGGDFVIVALHKVEDGTLEGKDEKARDNLRLSLERSRGRETFQHLVDQLRAEADVTITQ